MSFGKFSKSYFGSNYEKARKNFELATTRERLEFKTRDPRIVQSFRSQTNV